MIFVPESPAPPEKYLDALEPGDRGVILRFEGDGMSARRLMELGLVPGTSFEVVRRAPLGDPVEIRARNLNLALRRCEIARIRVTEG
jgi:ferrous iron transport protein A